MSGWGTSHMEDSEMKPGCIVFCCYKLYFSILIKLSPDALVISMVKSQMHGKCGNVVVLRHSSPWLHARSHIKVEWVSSLCERRKLREWKFAHTIQTIQDQNGNCLTSLTQKWFAFFLVTNSRTFHVSFWMTIGIIMLLHVTCTCVDQCVLFCKVI